MTQGDGLRRSIALLRAFRVEQTDPARFYSLMAADTLSIVGRFAAISGKSVLDVGAGRPQFAEAFSAAGARYVAVDPDRAGWPEGESRSGAVVAGRGECLPVREAAIDVTVASNVMEHVPDPATLGGELVRVTAPGGLIVVSYTNWLSPWGGHETSPFHYLGGDRAISRYARRYGHLPKNRLGETLFRISVSEGLAWARTQPGASLLCARPRYYPAWASRLVSIPGLRELTTWNLLLVLRRS